jgi:chorismate mutase
MEDRLADLRKQIDALDRQLIDLLAARLDISRQVSTAKQDKAQIFRPAREAQLLASLLAQAPESLHRLIPVVWRAIISSSIAEQRPDFTVIASAKMQAHAHAFSAGQLQVDNVPTITDVLARYTAHQEAKQAVILLVSPEELTEIAQQVGPDKPVMVVARLPLIGGAETKADGFVLAAHPADPTDYDEGVFYHQQGNRIEIAHLSSYEKTDRAHLLGHCAIFTPDLSEKK